MPDKNSIAIIGYSGHSYVVLEAAEKMGLNLEYYCEKDQAILNPFNLNYLGDESTEGFEWDNIDKFVLGIGDNRIRQKVAALLLSRRKEILKVLHPSSVVSDYASCGIGTFINANVVVNAFAKIGDYCILNTGCIIEHECVIDSGVHIAPGTVLAGNVCVGENAFIGANSVIKQGVKIGKGVTIGAGSVVIRDILDEEIWVGNPARKLK